MSIGQENACAIQKDTQIFGRDHTTNITQTPDDTITAQQLKRIILNSDIIHDFIYTFVKNIIKTFNKLQYLQRTDVYQITSANIPTMRT
jgi:hypothetical protein